MARGFGNTWWGEQWLRALSHIDFNSRLPRGARYARNGSVKSISITDGNILARVKGSRPSPYKVTITVPQFDQKQSKAFVDKLLGNPVSVATLMQRQLDSSVLGLAVKCGLKVFPDKWSDFNMHCSCPDWAVPCKHLAAVIYKLAEEIDNNPFLVFSLHGLDLLKQMEEHGIKQQIDATMNPPSISSIIAEGGEVRQPLQFGNPEIDLSSIPSVGGELMQLLPAHPPFYANGDFQKKYDDALKSASKAVNKAMKLAGSDPSMLDFAVDAELTMHLSDDFKITAAITSPTQGVQSLTLPEFIARLHHLSPELYGAYQPWVAALHKSYLFAADLVEKRNIMPVIVKLHSGSGYRVLWRPALMQHNVSVAARAINDSIPSGTLLLKKHPVGNAAEWIVGEMAGQLIHDASVGRALSDDQVWNMFFRGEDCTFKAIGTTEIPGGIQVWTHRLLAITGTPKPVFTVGETTVDDVFSLSIAIDRGNGETVPLEKVLKSSSPEALSAIGMLLGIASHIPGLTDCLRVGAGHDISLSGESFVEFLFNTIPLMRLIGLSVIMPKSLSNIIKPRVSMRIGATDNADTTSHLRLDSLLDFDWQIAIGNQMLTCEEFDNLMVEAGRLVKFKGQYVYAKASDLEKIRKFFSKSNKLGSSELLAIALSGEFDGAPVQLTREAAAVLDRLRRCPDMPVPANLNARLRPYQKRGFQWMVHNLSAGFGSIIADDMGLGKTLQVITVLLYLKNSGRLRGGALVVAPTGLLTNWQNEIGRFAPSLTTAVYHGSSRSVANLDGDIVLTSYGVVRSDLTRLKKHKWTAMVIDEAQNIKNTTAERTKAINSLDADYRIAMSGTPIENRLSEFWSIMNFTNKGYLGTQKDFAAKYAKPIQMEGSKSAAQRFRAVTAPFMMRRLKSDKSIIADLPDKIERNDYATLSPEQTALYRQTLSEAMAVIETTDCADSKSLFKRQGLVLQMILSLKQICNHPALFMHSGQADPVLSGKSMMLIDKVKAIVEAGEKVLIFTQFKEMGDLLANMIEAAVGRTPLFYHGGCTIRQRNALVERFQEVRADQVFILSLKAAGIGLNLTAATNVIHYDLWWNPAVEAQATDRAYRIGQKRNVQVSRFITQGTFEEKIDQMITSKKELANLTIENGESWLSKMTNDELRQIFAI